MDFYKMRTSEHRVAVVSLAAAGKTVFITSLIDDLWNHDPAEFPLGLDPVRNQVKIVRFRQLPPEPGRRPVEYKENRETLVYPTVVRPGPPMTKDLSQFVCEFERSDWKLHRVKLTLFDLAGERLADASMLLGDYATWSDRIFSEVLAKRDNCLDCLPYLSLVQRPSLTLQELVSSYKQVLACLALKYKPYITPSTFLLGVSGQVNQGRSVEEMVAGGCIGINVDEEFVPLPERVRTAQPDLAEQCAQRYQRYREEVVIPFVTALGSCHALIVLVDVMMLLTGGPVVYNNNKQIIVNLLDVLRPGQTPHGKIMANALNLLLPHPWRLSKVTRIAFVAPKLDQVHERDRDNMIPLLKGMLDRPASNYRGLVYKFFNCSAVVSTQSFEDEERWLCGSPLYNAEGRQQPPGIEQRYRVSTLPATWPQNWEPRQFSFPDVYPQMPPRDDAPPQQFNVNRILEFVLH